VKEKPLLLMIQPPSPQQMKGEHKQEGEGQEYTANTGTLDRYFITNKRTKQL
jgi:hypothetical protein